MKAAVKVLALMAVLGLVSYALAADAVEVKVEKVRGRVTKVEDSKITLTTGRGADAKEVVLTTDAKTKVTVDGKEATVKDVVVGLRVNADVTAGVATTITATKATGRGGAGGGAPAGGDAPKAPEAPKTN